MPMRIREEVQAVLRRSDGELIRVVRRNRLHFATAICPFLMYISSAVNRLLPQVLWNQRKFESCTAHQIVQRPAANPCSILDLTISPRVINERNYPSP